MIDATAIHAFRDELRKPVEIGGFVAYPNDWHVNDPAALVKAGPQAAALAVNSLGAVRDYLKANRDDLALAKIVVHVVSPSTVRVLGPLDPRSRTRETFLQATCADLTDGFVGQFMSHENFVIGLQTRFNEIGQRTDILRLMSGVKTEAVKQSQDDGISQVVTARNGSVLVADVAVPNPVTLWPFRTFRDVDQPHSIFVLRVQQGKEGGLPTIGVFEADGGAWKLTAVDRLREWLKKELPATVEVLA